LNKKTIIPTAEPFLLPGGRTGCVLIHGFTGSPKEMRIIGDFLFKNNITALGIRLAGHATQVQDMARTRWKDWLACVEDGINFLSQSCDYVFLAGLSMGGALSLLAASIYPVSGIIAMSTPYEIVKDWRINFAKPISFFFPFIKKETNDISDKDAAKAHVDYSSYPTRSIAELKNLLDLLHTQVTTIDAPILLINSKGDLSFPVSHMKKYQQLIASPKLETMLLEKSRHVITEDVERDVVFQAVLNFIQKHSN
jgi:carboxylesterase